MTESPKPLLSELTDAEVHRRVKELIALGNSPKVAALILLQAGVLQEQVDAALQHVQQEKQAELKEQNYLGWVIVLVSIILVLIAVYFWLNGTAGSKAPVSAASNSGTLMNGILEAFLENQNIPPVNDMPEPFIELDETGQVAACPASEQKAGALFGGSSGTWTYQTDADGWLFYNDTPSALTIPTNMAGSVAYGSARAPKFSPLIGPVKVSKVHMAFILCP